VKEVIDRVMNSVEIQSGLNGQRHQELRTKVANYIAMLSSTGHRDANKLIEFGLAYLRGLHEGPDSRYTGC